jgi:hypothetical protein
VLSEKFTTTGALNIGTIDANNDSRYRKMSANTKPDSDGFHTTVECVCATWGHHDGGGTTPS